MPVYHSSFPAVELRANELNSSFPAVELRANEFSPQFNCGRTNLHKIWHAAGFTSRARPDSAGVHGKCTSKGAPKSYHKKR